jgi:outer membrane biosynthesis protein TonB
VWALVLWLAAAPTNEAEMAATKLRIIRMINQSGPGIDRCNQRYLSEVPGQGGQATISLVIDPKGKVTRSRVECALPNSRTLKTCIDMVARRWAFPPPEKERTFTLQVPVSAERFRIRLPGESEDAPPAQEEDPGFMNLSGFLPEGW